MKSIPSKAPSDYPDSEPLPLYAEAVFGPDALRRLPKCRVMFFIS